MSDYPIAPWLLPSAAQGWGELALGAAKSRADVQMERDRLSQQAAQSAIESQQKSQELAQQAEETQARMQAASAVVDYNHIMDQQKLAVDQAYKTQQLGMQAQTLDIAQKKFDDQTAEAAKRFAANASFQKAMLPVDQGGEGLAPDKASLKYLAPYMTGTQVGKMTATAPPFDLGTPKPIPGIPGKLGVETSRNHYQILDAPVTGTNAPVSMPVTGEDGTIGYWVTPPGGGRPHWQPVQKTTSDTDLRALIKAKAAGKTSTAVDAKAPVAGNPPTSRNEVTRITKDGGTAVFDAKTKQFIRWLIPPPATQSTPDYATPD